MVHEAEHRHAPVFGHARRRRERGTEGLRCSWESEVDEVDTNLHGASQAALQGTNVSHEPVWSHQQMQPFVGERQRDRLTPGER